MESSAAGVATAAVGVLVTATFAVACVAALVIGRVADAAGPRRRTLVLAGLVLLGMLAAALAPGYGWLLAALAVTGLAQALANPTPNLLIVGRVAGPRRAVAIGVKQSWVQLSAFAAGLALAPLAMPGRQRLPAVCTVHVTNSRICLTKGSLSRDNLVTCPHG